MIDKLLQAPLSDLENGYSYDTDDRLYICLVCGKKFEAGEVFPFDGRFYDASRAVRIHIEKEHGNLFEILTSFDKKYTGITDNQKDLLAMLYSGLSDREIAQKTNAAPATIRHQRFVFREKAKQAKLYLSIFETVEKAALERRGKNMEDELADIHSSAKMIDDRYLTTKAEEDKILHSAFASLQPLKLKVLSPKEKKKIVILRKIAEQFEQGKTYSEKEVNSILSVIYDDYVSVRRYLIEYGFMKRTNDGKEYWLV